MYGFSTQNLNFEETREQNLSIKDGYVGLWCLTPLSTIFHLYRDGYVYVLGMKLVRFIKRVDPRTSIKHTELCSSGFLNVGNKLNGFHWLSLVDI